MERKGSNTKIEVLSSRELNSLEAGSVVQVELIFIEGGGDAVCLVEYKPQTKVFVHLSNEEILCKALRQAL